MAKKKIYINPGHSNTDPGAVGYEVERKLNVKVSNYQKEYLLENYECEVKMNPGTMSSLSTIANDANKWGADLMVSNHFNAGKGNGWEGLVYSEKNRDLGKMFEKYVKAIGQNSRGVKLRPDLGILRLTDCPAILTESAFVDNWNDIKDWNDNAELKKLGIAYAKASADFLNLPKKAKKTTTSTKKTTTSSTTKKTTTSTKKSDDFLVKVTATALNIRSGAGTKYDVVGVIKDKGTYTIVEVKGDWGKLKSGKGWIHLDYTKKVKA